MYAFTPEDFADEEILIFQSMNLKSRLYNILRPILNNEMALAA